MRHKVTKFMLYAFMACIVLAAAISFLWPNDTLFAQSASEDNVAREIVIIKRADGTAIEFEVELAITAEQQTQGLMNRPSMTKNHGMLFLFNNLSQRSFWMQNTLIPLDMLFLNRDGTIHHIHHNAVPLDPTFITSGRPAWAVLELNGGISKKLGIHVGDIVHHDAFKATN